MASWKAIDGPGWHEHAKTPVVDGKYVDRETGEIRTAEPHSAEYLGPPAVDIIIQAIHADVTQCVYRASRQYPMEALLYNIMKVVKERNLEGDSIMATTYAIRITLAGNVTTVDMFSAVADEMSNGIFDLKEK